MKNATDSDVNHYDAPAIEITQLIDLGVALRKHMKLLRTYFKKLSQPIARDEGFTLIELLVVLLIIGILLAIAVPTYLTVTKSASDTASESNLQTALTGAATYYTQNGGGYDTTVANIGTDLSGLGTGLDYVVGANPSTAAGIVSLDEVDTNDLVLAAYSKGNSRCYYIADDKGGTLVGTMPLTSGAYYGYTLGATLANCLATNFTNVVAIGGATGTGAWQTTGGFPS